MKLIGAVSIGVAAAAVMTVSAAGQGTTQPPAPSPTQDQTITLVGCVQREADYRRTADAGRGGAAGTGIGVDNEYILVNASPSGAAAAGEARAVGGGATGGASTAVGTGAYELTGPNEGQLKQYVGQRVEITGKLKAAETTATGRPTGGATAGTPPSGIDVASKDLRLSEVEVATVKPATGTCTVK
jgi:hypothetical protein